MCYQMNRTNGQAVLSSGREADSVWEQKKPEARKMFVNRAESNKSAARFVSPLCFNVTAV